MGAWSYTYKSATAAAVVLVVKKRERAIDATSTCRSIQKLSFRVSVYTS